MSYIFYKNLNNLQGCIDLSLPKLASVLVFQGIVCSCSWARKQEEATEISVSCNRSNKNNKNKKFKPNSKGGQLFALIPPPTLLFGCWPLLGAYIFFTFSMGINLCYAPEDRT